MHYVDEQHIVYPAGSLVVMLDMSTNTQSFFTDHDDDVVALCLHPSRRIAASGQVFKAAYTSSLRPHTLVA